MGFNSPDVTSRRRLLSSGSGGDNRDVSGSPADGYVKCGSVTFSVRTTNPGYVGIGFNSREVYDMAGSTILVLRKEDNGQASVQVHEAVDKDLSGSTLNPSATAAVYNNLTFSESNGVRTFTFSLDLFERGPSSDATAGVSTNALGGASLTRNVLTNIGKNNLLWAMSGSNNLDQHDRQGALSINFATGSVAVVFDPVRPYWKVHGILMTTAFCIFFPLAAVMGILKKVLTGSSTIIGLETWFQLHRLFVGLATGLGLAGWIMALVKFDTITGYADALPKSHGILGLVLMALALVQVLIGTFRPDKTAPKRPAWRLVHRFVGILVVLILMPVVIYTGTQSYQAAVGSEAKPLVIYAAVAGPVLWVTVMISVALAHTGRRARAAGYSSTAVISPKDVEYN